MNSQKILSALAFATAVHAAPAGAAPDSDYLADTNKAAVVKVLGHQDTSIRFLFGPD